MKSDCNQLSPIDSWSWAGLLISGREPVSEVYMSSRAKIYIVGRCCRIPNSSGGPEGRGLGMLEAMKNLP